MQVHSSLFEEIHDDSAFIERAGWVEFVQPEGSNETFGGELDELGGILVRIDFIQGVYDPQEELAEPECCSHIQS